MADILRAMPGESSPIARSGGLPVFSIARWPKHCLSSASKVVRLEFMWYVVRLRRVWGLTAIALMGIGAWSQLGCNAAQGSGVDSRQILYVGNRQPNVISAYNIGQDGTLSAMSGSPFPVAGDSLIADPNGRALFSSGLTADTIHLYTEGIAEDGSLKVSASLTDNTLAGVRAINRAGTNLYVSSINAAENNWGWKVYSVLPNGTLRFVNGLIDQAAGRLIFTPDGTTAFAAYCYHLLPNVEQFSVASNGMLTNTMRQIATDVPYGECPNAVALTPGGDHLAAPWSNANSSGSAENLITLFNVDAGNHELQPAAGASFAASGAGQDAVFDPSGKFLITAQDNGVGVYRVSQNSLAEVSGSPFGGVAMDRVMFTASGSFLITISGATGQIFVFAMDSATGSITLAPGSPLSTPAPYDLAIVKP